MAFKHFLALKTNQSGIANFDGVAKALGELASPAQNSSENIPRW